MRGLLSRLLDAMYVPFIILVSMCALLIVTFLAACIFSFLGGKSVSYYSDLVFQVARVLGFVYLFTILVFCSMSLMDWLKGRDPRLHGLVCEIFDFAKGFVIVLVILSGIVYQCSSKSYDSCGSVASRYGAC